ncbi:MAG: acyltransferase [Alphaproteobacteria bacterium]|nr:acyltransferase [Alphaproteobacteria bacterium]
MLAKDYGETNFITGLRAFAALAVVLIHAGGAGFRAWGEIGNHIVDLGRAGVYVFFVISGYSVSVSYARSKNYFEYINKRLWRIAPLYFFWIGASIMLKLCLDPASLEELSPPSLTYNLLMHASFLSFLDPRVANSLLSVEWSIPIEVFWYFLVPLLWRWSRAVSKIGLCLVVSLSAYIAADMYATSLGVEGTKLSLAFHWSPVPYFFSYCLGVAAFRLRAIFVGRRRTGNLAFAFVALWLAAFVVAPLEVNAWFYDEFVLISFLTFVLIVYGSPQSDLFRWVFTPRPVLFLGTISYGIYLSHVLVLGRLIKGGFSFLANPPLKFFVLALAATAVSTVMFYVLERPGQALGRALARAARERLKTNELKSVAEES